MPKFLQMPEPGSRSCSMCGKDFCTSSGLKRHLTRKNHLERVRYHFQQTVKIWLGDKARTWDEKVENDKRDSNRRRQQRLRDLNKIKILG